MALAKYINGNNCTCITLNYDLLLEEMLSKVEDYSSCYKIPMLNALSRIEKNVNTGSGLLLLLLLFGLFVKIFPVIDNAADRRLRGRSNLEQIKPVQARDFKSLLRRDDAELLAARTDAADFGNADALIAARTVVATAPIVSSVTVVSVAVHSRTSGAAAAKLLGDCHSVFAC